MSLRVFLTSDCHTNEPENRKLVEEMFFPPATKKQSSSTESVLIIAGDVSYSLHDIERTLSLLVKRYDHVFYCVGNNELRVYRKKAHGVSVSVGRDERNVSMRQYEEIMSICERLGVKTRAERIQSTWICPVVSWYSPYFFGEDYLQKHPNYQRGWLDFRHCNFADGEPLEYFRRWMENDIERVNREKQPGENVISFSHFLPRIELLPQISIWIRPTFPLVTGNEFIEKCLRELGSTIHCYGHTHINGTRVIDGVTYVQHAVAHVEERNRPWYQRLLSGLHPTYIPKEIYKANQ